MVMVDIRLGHTVRARKDARSPVFSYNARLEKAKRITGTVVSIDRTTCEVEFITYTSDGEYRKQREVLTFFLKDLELPFMDAFPKKKETKSELAILRGC